MLRGMNGLPEQDSQTTEQTEYRTDRTRLPIPECSEHDFKDETPGQDEYVGQPEKHSENRTGRPGQAKQNKQNRTGRTRQEGQDRKDRTGRTGQEGQERKDKRGRTREEGQDRTGQDRTGKAEQDIYVIYAFVSQFH